MKSDLTVQEQQYVNQILDILKSSGVSPSYREDAKIQLIEHIREARLHNEDFRKDLGSPEDFALHFMDTAITKEELPGHRIEYPSSSYKKPVSFKTPFAFILLAGFYYFGLQFITVLAFTPVLAPGIGSEFHLFKVSDYLWWNLLVIGINALLALVLSGMTMKLLGRRYRFS
ncbi:hypothetical protein [Cytobacillus firmus]|uniref:hypothetical protein n=1 Tax=Cytobacillus firmus TaxID=1399 RepID=UPI0021616AE2|nr:hypothetical protein [Cytobacillus firmus]MCS0670049.1 hypothetical protein [Cytobacillus firmus]MCS0787955.1 hypothetical protein [Cytobacillus firmus]